MAHPARALRYLWALPNTLLGLALGLLSFLTPQTRHGVVVFEGPVRGSLWVLALVGRTAITFGHVVLSTRPLRGRLVAHELHHVRQYEQLGPLFLPLYLVIWLFTGYRHHPFELAAMAAEGLPVPSAQEAPVPSAEELPVPSAQEAPVPSAEELPGAPAPSPSGPPEMA